MSCEHHQLLAGAVSGCIRIIYFTKTPRYAEDELKIRSHTKAEAWTTPSLIAKSNAGLQPLAGWHPDSCWRCTFSPDKEVKYLKCIKPDQTNCSCLLGLPKDAQAVARFRMGVLGWCWGAGRAAPRSEERCSCSIRQQVCCLSSREIIWGGKTETIMSLRHCEPATASSLRLVRFRRSPTGLGRCFRNAPHIAHRTNSSDGADPRWMPRSHSG
jgi:hypothetical protein